MNSSKPNYTPALVVLTSLFFTWGLITSLNDILVPHFKAGFTLNYVQAMLVQLCFFSAYFVASIPAGVPPKFSGGSVNAGFCPSVILDILRLFAVASAGVPPTNWTIAGDAAIAKPPSPLVSVMAESPRSAAASSMP